MKAKKYLKHNCSNCKSIITVNNIDKTLRGYECIIRGFKFKLLMEAAEVKCIQWGKKGKEAA